MDLVLGVVALDEVVPGVVQIISPVALAGEQEILLQISRSMPPVEADRKR